MSTRSSGKGPVKQAPPPDTEDPPVPGDGPSGFPLVDRVIDAARKEARKEVGRILRDMAKIVDGE